VADDGCGMDGSVMDRLFEPFFTTKAAGRGTGLGLATVYGIVQQNAGFISVDSEPGQGSTFNIYLPRLEADAATPEPPPGDAGSLQGHETILVVEDEPAILEIIRMILQQQGYAVLAAGGPAAAASMAAAHEGGIDLLLTDVIMPEMNGRDLAMSLESRFPRLKRLFMSGHTADIIADHGVLAEGVNFIAKPFSMTDLLVKVREVLGES
jgi:CheY-like chemotaxis protein